MRCAAVVVEDCAAPTTDRVAAAALLLAHLDRPLVKPAAAVATPHAADAGSAGDDDDGANDGLGEPRTVADLMRLADSWQGPEAAS